MCSGFRSYTFIKRDSETAPMDWKRRFEEGCTDPIRYTGVKGKFKFSRDVCPLSYRQGTKEPEIFKTDSPVEL